MEQREESVPKCQSDKGDKSPWTVSRVAYGLAALIIIASILISNQKKFLSEDHHDIVNPFTKTPQPIPDEKRCLQTCRVEIVESIPQNVDFGDAKIPRSTYSAWKSLIENAENQLSIAAYKSSLQGKHVLGNLSAIFSKEGDDIYKALLKRGLEKKGVRIDMIENYPPKDKGDNEDGVSLMQKGAINRRYLTIANILGRGMMHSKFLLADHKNFYIGSANLDWRSLNQKMELGLLVEDCPCLGEDLDNIYDSYWHLTKHPQSYKKFVGDQTAMYNAKHPLDIDIAGDPSQIYIATSPRELNHKGRTWDLDAILEAINSAEKFLYIHVMDYFPMFVYRKPKSHWGAIDDAIRAAVVRGVEVRLLTAALHYPELGTAFLRSLQMLDHATEKSSIEAKIFKVPSPMGSKSVISRERRTHNKFMVTESTVIIGTSNWSGDYFESGTTGAAVVIYQRGEHRSLVEELREIFERDYDSEYAHTVDDYYNNCITNKTAEYCEGEKDPQLFANAM